MPNRLIDETSPYLRQHAHNPVDWYPWCPEALERARGEDKPIFLSIGYSACHWCHVMERESFEDPQIARIMNERFINIKVDREERPDLDSIYMQAVQALSGQGGWPMSVFLTPQGEPFYGGAYFPPEDRGGHPAFPGVLQAVAEAYRNRRSQVSLAARQVSEALRRASQVRASREPLIPAILQQAAHRIGANFDSRYGGFGTAPKFPQPMVLEFLLRHWRRSRDQVALQMVERTLEGMAYGGIYDQVGGGFHRYSTDTFWLAPHFEKMLYDNALLSRLYLHAYQATGRPLYRRIAEETLDYALREMTAPEGGFYSTQDADSEGHEGRYYVWTPDELAAALGKEDGQQFGRIYGVTLEGNFEGRSILHLPQPPEEAARELGMAPAELDAFVSSCRARLLAARARRTPPARDEKALAAWNGLMLRSFAEAGAALGRRDYIAAAERSADFVLDNLGINGRLMRSYKDGRANHKGYLEDYAMLADGLLALYEATFRKRWLDVARELARGMVELFWSESEGAFYDTGADHETLVARPRDVFDNATPSGGAVATEVLLRLAVLTGERDLASKAARALRSVRDYMEAAPAGLGHWLCALDFYLSTPKEIAIVGPWEASQALRDEVFRRYLPNRVVAGWDGADQLSAEGLPLLANRGMVDAQPTAYVCQDYFCQLPVTTPEALAAQLDG